VTQHYADFSVQVEAIMGGEPKAARTHKAVVEVLLRGLRVGGHVFEKERSRAF